MKNILAFLLEGYADWETGYSCAKLNKPGLGYRVQTVSTGASPVISSGNFSTNVDYALDSYQDFENLAALLLIGGTGWGDEALIRGYHPDRYDLGTAKKINDFVNKCLSNNILVAGICDGATFLADNGHLNAVPHTGNTCGYLKEKAPSYTGESLFPGAAGCKWWELHYCQRHSRPGIHQGNPD